MGRSKRLWEKFREQEICNAQGSPGSWEDEMGKRVFTRQVRLGSNKQRRFKVDVYESPIQPKGLSNCKTSQGKHD